VDTERFLRRQATLSLQVAPRAGAWIETRGAGRDSDCLCLVLDGWR